MHPSELSDAELGEIGRRLGAFSASKNRALRRWARHRVIELQEQRPPDDSGCEGLDDAQRQGLGEYLLTLRDSAAGVMPGVADWANDSLIALVDDQRQAEAAFDALVRQELSDLDRSTPT